MIHFPTSLEKLSGLSGEFRAGGTDLSERRHHHIATGDLIDLRDLGGLDQIQGPLMAGEGGEPGGLRVGARVKIAALAANTSVQQGWPGLAAAAGGLATPEIRAVGTVGGNLTQRVRCWYYRSPQFECLKKGGSTCFAREGDHLFHSCFDLGACVAPHPSTLGMALLAYDAQLEIHGGRARTASEFFGDGSNPRRENTLEEGALVTGVLLPAPWAGEKAAYFRAISRARAEWPLVEVLVRLSGEQTVGQARVVVGGVATIPLRLTAVEQVLVGSSPTQELLERASSLAAQGASPLPMTAYKVGLLKASVLEALERALAGRTS